MRESVRAYSGAMHLRRRVGGGIEAASAPQPPPIMNKQKVATTPPAAESPSPIIASVRRVATSRSKRSGSSCLRTAVAAWLRRVMTPLFLAARYGTRLRTARYNPARKDPTPTITILPAQICIRSPWRRADGCGGPSAYSGEVCREAPRPCFPCGLWTLFIPPGTVVLASEERGSTDTHGHTRKIVTRRRRNFTNGASRRGSRAETRHVVFLASPQLRCPCGSVDSLSLYRGLVRFAVKPT
jgi:hypothetical protein